MKPIIALVAAASLTACAVVETAAVDTGRAAAKAAVTPIVADTVPGPAGVAITDCIIDNASGQELLTLAAGGTSAENVALVGEILARTETVACATSALT
ncbi:succinate dehydrogenase [Octadecabacter sp. CECT 8868]|uniref:succinate dehydrogenase n=1 Tax=Octadecabacter algicola TaxID=2909342 RepID=UPI001F445C9A|nr:succinate dehydrogenase [Octadecabacter algicola]MCF2906596.1 succinate dehydrogenase [Octadecabacter algicola]